MTEGVLFYYTPGKALYIPFSPKFSGLRKPARLILLIFAPRKSKRTNVTAANHGSIYLI
jgi:hypothetical protein